MVIIAWLFVSIGGLFIFIRWFLVSVTWFLVSVSRLLVPIRGLLVGVGVVVMVTLRGLLQTLHNLSCEQVNIETNIQDDCGDL